VFAVTPSTKPLVDIGVNLTHESFSDDFEHVVERAKDSNIQHMVVTGSDLKESVAAAKMAAENPNLFSATAGIHPHYAEQYDENTNASIASLLLQPTVRAVGETGLDYFRDISPREKQVRSFEAHIELAIENRMPMFLHQREAHKDFLPIIKTHRQALSKLVVHCFTDTADALKDYLDLDCHIGITGWICDERRGQHLLECVDSIPLNRLMIETDSPYLMPRTLKPKPKTRRNEPCTLPEILRSIASVRSESCEEIAQASTENAQQFFGFDHF